MLKPLLKRMRGTSKPCIYTRNRHEATDAIWRTDALCFRFCFRPRRPLGGNMSFQHLNAALCSPAAEFFRPKPAVTGNGASKRPNTKPQALKPEPKRETLCDNSLWVFTSHLFDPLFLFKVNTLHSKECVRMCF